MDQLGHDLIGPGPEPVLVTGATGYLGQRIVAAFRARDIPIRTVGRDDSADIRCDLTDREAVAGSIPAHALVVHTAAHVPKQAADYDDENQAALSLSMVANLLSRQPSRLVFTSSMTVYGPGSMPVREEHAGAPTSGYAGAKRRAEEMIEAASVPSVVLRLPGLFGPPRRGGLLYEAVRALCAGRSVSVPADPPLWAALHVDDAAELCLRAVMADIPKQVVLLNAGYAGSFTIPGAVTEIAELLGMPPPRALPEAPSFAMDLSRMEDTLGLLSHGWRGRLEDLIAWTRRADA